MAEYIEPGALLITVLAFVLWLIWAALSSRKQLRITQSQQQQYARHLEQVEQINQRTLLVLEGWRRTFPGSRKFWKGSTTRTDRDASPIGGTSVSSLKSFSDSWRFLRRVAGVRPFAPPKTFAAREQVVGARGQARAEKPTGDGGQRRE